MPGHPSRTRPAPQATSQARPASDRGRLPAPSRPCCGTPARPSGRRFPDQPPRPGRRAAPAPSARLRSPPRREPCTTRPRPRHAKALRWDAASDRPPVGRARWRATRGRRRNLRCTRREALPRQRISGRRERDSSRRRQAPRRSPLTGSPRGTGTAGTGMSLR